MKKPLTAVVLAGGSGSRFWPFTQSKTLFPFFGKPLVDFSVISQLPSEVDDVVIVSNAENRHALQNTKFSKPVLTVLQPQPLGMANALLSAAAQLADRRLLVIIADDVAHPSLLRDVLSVAKSKKDAFAVLAGWKASTYFPGGYMRMDGDRVLGIVEKPAPDALPSPYVAISGHYFADSNSLLEELKRTRVETDDAYEQAITMLALREKIYVSPYARGFSSLKYPWNVLDTMDVLFEEQFKARKGKGVHLGANVIIDGPVCFGDNVRVFENTKIIGPCYIGDNTIIGNNNIVRHSHIGANCVTGFNTDITRSYIGDSCWFHSNYIGDSILAGNISMGSGAVLANLRLDDGVIFSTVKNARISTSRTKLGSMIGSHTRIGVNASIMPGIKIGSQSFIGSGIVVDRDIPEKSFVSLGKQTFTIAPNTNTSSPVSRDAFKKLL